MILPAAPRGIDEERRLASKPVAEVAKEFEALLVAQMIGAMRKTIPQSGMLEVSAARRMLDGAFDTELARSITAGGGLGVARQLTAQLEKRTAASRETDAGEAVMPTALRPGTLDRLAVHRAGAVGVSAACVGEGPGAAAEQMIVPVDGRITSDFGMRRDPFTRRARFHGGIDVAAPAGSPIRAAADGEVVFSGRDGKSGNLVAIRHDDGTVTRYAHAARTLVHVGQRVAAGDVVATVGSSGRSTGPHLHFAVERDGQLLDPAAFLTRVPEARVALAYGGRPREGG
jgi:murein DD-endopeptidase MepM/ murein hydrolase activator NlpD